MKKVFGLLLLLLISINGFTQTINKVEYFINTDPGFGSGTDVPITPAANISNLLVPVDISALSKGMHNVYLRSQNNSGHWSLTNRWLFFNDKTAAVNINKVEYFTDTDPGFGNGTDVPITPGNPIINLIIPVDISALTNGIHNIYVRSKDDQGNWSLTNRWLFFKDIAAGNINKFEYFIDTDPGFGNAVNVPVTPSGNIINLLIPIDISSLSNGFHNIYLRSKDDNGLWSLTNRWLFFKDIPQNNVQRGEYFFDTDPGFGNGTPIPYSGPLGTDVPDFSFGADINSLSNGSHYLFIRTQEANGKWSLTNVFPFTKSVPLPVTLINFTARAEGSRALLNWQTATEINNDRFEIERNVDGINFIKIGQVAGAGNSNSLLSYQYYDEHPEKGNNYYRLRQVDLDGKFNYSPTRLVNFKGNSYFAILNNPTSGNPIIVKTTETNATLSIFDETGKKIKDLQMTGTSISISVDQLPNGVYLLVLHKDGAVKAAEKFVVRR
jgi:Secretion system C-terminal sorting domain